MKTANSQGLPVIVVGGGPAGIATALSLQLGGINSLVLAKPEKAPRKVGESLPAGCRPLLQKLGVESLLKEGPHFEIPGNVSAWGSSELQSLDFIQDPQGAGWRLDRRRWEEDLRSFAAGRGIEFVDEAVESLAWNEGRWQIVTSQQKTFSCAWLVDASGRRSLVARASGVRRERDDQLFASFAWFESSPEDQDLRTLIEATAEGWWYTSKLPDGSRVVSFHTEAEIAKNLADNLAEFQARVATTEHVSAIIASLQPLETVHCREAGGSRLDQFFGDGWIAVGDAALSFDPLSSQGIFNALATGLSAGEALVKTKKGDLQALNSYAEQLERVRQIYLNRSKIYYAAESRWWDQPFWRNRVFGRRAPGTKESSSS